MIIIKPFRYWASLSAWKKILLALVLGIVTGLIMGPSAHYLKPIGNLFIHAIHMIIGPVVFTAIVCAILAIHNLQLIKRVIIKAAILYAACMSMAALIGIVMGRLFTGDSGHLISLAGTSAPAIVAPHFVDLLENIIPANPFQSFADENVLQILVFSVLLGTAINMAGKAGEPVAKLFQSFSIVVFKLAQVVISFAPYGIFALIAWTFGEFGIKAFIPLARFIAGVYLGCFLQLFLVYGLISWLLLRINPFKFFKNILTAMIFAFTTSSSAATLPVSMRCAEENLRISPQVTRFLLPLGASFNLNGLAIYLSVATIFAANLYGIHLTMTQHLVIIFTIVFTAMGAAAVPGSALIVMGAVMNSVGIPLGAIAIIAGVDRLNDMMQTATNVAGDLFTCNFIAMTEGEVAKPAAEKYEPVTVA